MYTLRRIKIRRVKWKFYRRFIARYYIITLLLLQSASTRIIYGRGTIKQKSNPVAVRGLCRATALLSFGDIPACPYTACWGGEAVTRGRRVYTHSQRSGISGSARTAVDGSRPVAPGTCYDKSRGMTAAKWVKADGRGVRTRALA